jgi:hypothetical protein
MLRDKNFEAAISGGGFTNFEFYRSHAVAEESIVKRGKSIHCGYLCRTNRIKEEPVETCGFLMYEYNLQG